MTEVEELEIDLRAVYGEIFPQPGPLIIGSDVVALGVLLRREMRLAAKATVSPAELRQATRDRKDPE